MYERALEYAKRVAFRMSRDPEVESIAAEAAWRAVDSYDGRIPLERWIALRVRYSVWAYWRSRAKERHFDITEWWHRYAVPRIKAGVAPEAVVNDAIRQIEQLSCRMVYCSSEWWDCIPAPEDDGAEPIDVLLWEHHVEHKSAERLAELHGTSKYKMRRKLRAAKARFLQRVGVT